MRKGLTEVRKAMHWQFMDYNVKDFRQVLDVIIPNWTTDQTKFQESVILSEFLRERIDNELDQEVKTIFLFYERRYYGKSKKR